jgi:hypothetical protein
MTNKSIPHKADIWLAQLGWTALRGQMPRGDGPVEFRVIAPWCPDCVDWGPEVSRNLPGEGRAVFLVGEFAQAREILGYAEKHWPAELPVLHGTTEKSEIARISARFRQMRTALGDARKWGVPTVIQGRLFNGRLLVENLFDPSA